MAVRKNLFGAEGTQVRKDLFREKEEQPQVREGLFGTTNPLEDIYKKREEEKLQAEQQAQVAASAEQQKAADPKNWSADQLKDYYKENPPKNLTEAVKAKAAMAIKGIQEKEMVDLLINPVKTGADKAKKLQKEKEKKKQEEELGARPIETDLGARDLKISGEEKPFEKMTKFQKILDVIGRPGYAMKSIIKAHGDKLKKIRDNPDLTDEEKIKQMEDTTFGIGETMQAAWKGLSGEERVTANQIWKDLGVEGVPFLGFATEIATDPLMYGGYQAITKGVGKGVGLVGKGIKKIPGVAKGLAYAGEKVQPVASALKEMFVSKTGIGKLGKLMEKSLLKREYLKGAELKFGIKTRNVMQNIAKKTGRSIDDVEKQIVNLIEQPQITPSGVPAESIALANTIKSHLSNLLTKEMKAGVPISSLAKGARNIEYFPRITTKEARQYLKNAKVGNAKVWNTKLSNALRRKTGDFTLQEFNDFVATHGLKSLGGRAVEEFFIRNPAYAVATRGIKSAKAVTSAEFLKGVGETFGLKKAPSFWQELPDEVTKLNPSLKGLKFDPEVMTEITRVTKSYFNPHETKIFLKAFDSIQNLWKKWTLAPFPKYHLRNMVGNIWNNYIGGVVNPKVYGKAQAVQMYRKYKNTSGKLKDTVLANLKTFGITPEKAADIILQGEKLGVLGHGWYAADIETGVKGAMRPGFTEKGMAIGSTIENNARLAHFIDKLDKGWDGMEAATSVKKFLFDYGDLTAFEKQVMKRLFPFYTWTRKNIPLQLENIWKQPQKYAPLTAPLRSRDPKDLLKLKYARPELYERLPIELKRDADKVTYVPLEGLIPAADLAKLVRPQEIFVELLTPYLRAPIELQMNKSFYFESEIQKYPGETQELLRMDLPAKLKYVAVTILPQARLLNELNKLTKKVERKEPLTPAETAFHHSLSSIYKVSIKDLRRRALQNLQKKKEELEKGAFWAKRYKRDKEYKRIKETYAEFNEIMKEIKTD